MVVI
ncbi:hypothetical protein FWK35_00029002 [Aphis craccivora]|jgi:F-box/leucine-rich repeat protein 2/20